MMYFSSLKRLYVVILMKAIKRLAFFGHRYWHFYTKIVFLTDLLLEIKKGRKNFSAQANREDTLVSITIKVIDTRVSLDSRTANRISQEAWPRWWNGKQKKIKVLDWTDFFVKKSMCALFLKLERPMAYSKASNFSNPKSAVCIPAYMTKNHALFQHEVITLEWGNYLLILKRRLSPYALKREVFSIQTCFGKSNVSTLYAYG